MGKLIRAVVSWTAQPQRPLASWREKRSKSTFSYRAPVQYW